MRVGKGSFINKINIFIGDLVTCFVPDGGHLWTPKCEVAVNSIMDCVMEYHFTAHSAV